MQNPAKIYKIGVNPKPKPKPKPKPFGLAVRYTSKIVVGLEFSILLSLDQRVIKQYKVKGKLCIEIPRWWHQM